MEINESVRGISILVVEDNSIFRNGLIELLSNHEIIRYIKSVRDGLQALDLIKKERFDILLLDMDTQADMGAEALEGIYKLNITHKPKIIIISAHSDSYHIMRAFATGIQGYILKNTFIKEILKAFTLVNEGTHYYSTEIATTLLNVLIQETRPPQRSDDILTEQEKKILYYICQQWGNGEIAKELSLAEYTIMRHKQNIKEKIGAKNLVGYVTYALKHNIVRLSDL